MTNRSLSFTDVIDADALALQIAERWGNFKQDDMYNRWADVYESLYADKFHRAQPHQSRAVFPKATQMADTIKANLMAAVMPNERFFEYQSTSREDNSKAQRDVVSAYAKSKIEQRSFRPLLDELTNDFAHTGNVFATSYIHTEYSEDENGTQTIKYQGPAWERIDPYDIRFDHTIPFDKTWVIIRSVKQISQLARMIEERPDLIEARDAFERLIENRRKVRDLSQHDFHRYAQAEVNGVTTLMHDLRNGDQDTVEVLEFRGDIWDQDNNKLIKDKRIIIWDGHIVAHSANLMTRGHGVHHCGYRTRPNTTWAQGPFENLQGMQHYVNSLLNSAADAINFASNPIFVTTGGADIPVDQELSPGSIINLSPGETFDVKSFDTQAAGIASNTAITMINLMEEMANVPKQAAGIRTPGERTAFEVQQLSSASNRMFNEVAQRFEIMVIEPLINDVIELARKYGDTLDTIRVIGEDKTIRFMQLDRTSLGRTGTLRVKGARHFAETQQRLASLNQGIATMQALGIPAHINDWKAAEMFSEMLGLDDFGVIEKNAAIFSAAEKQRLSQTASEEAMVVANTDIDTPDLELEEDENAEEFE